MKYLRNKKFRGITLIEVLLGVFVFTTIVVATSAIFSSSFDVKKSTQNAQQRYSLVFGTLDEMGKFLSTSTLMMSDTTSISADQTITVYSYSTNECVQYNFDSATSKLRTRRKLIGPTTPYTDCNDAYLGAVSWQDALDTYVKGGFTVRAVNTNSGEEHSGMILIYADVYAKDPTVTVDNAPVTVQTVVSLRDYLPGT